MPLDDFTTIAHTNLECNFFINLIFKKLNYKQFDTDKADYTGKT